DRWGNLVPGCTVALDMAKGIGRYMPEDSTTTVRATNGQGIIELAYRSTLVSGKETLIAMAGIDPNAAAGSTQINQLGIPKNIYLTSDKMFLTANGADTALLTAQVVNGNSMPVYGAKVLFTPSESIQVTSATTNEDGFAYAVYTSTTQAGLANVIAAVEGTVHTDTTTLTLLPDLSSPTVSLQASVSTVPVTIGQSTSTALITVEVKDAYNNPISNDLVYFQVLEGDGVIAGSTVTNINGQGQLTYTSGGLAGRVRIQASEYLADHSAILELTQSPGPASSIEMTANPPILLNGNGGTAGSTLIAQAADANGNPRPGELILFQLMEGTGTIDPSSTADETGKATTTLTTNMTAGRILVKSRTISPEIDATLELPIYERTLSLAAVPGTLTAGADEPAALVATLAYDNGQPIAGVPIQWEKVSGEAELVVLSTMTNNSGQTYARLFAAPSTGATRVRAFAPSYDPAMESVLGIDVRSAAPSTMEVTATTNVVVADLDGSTITVSIQDTYGNPVPSQAVAFEILSGPGSLSPLSATTDEQGETAAWFNSQLIGATAIRIAVNNYPQLTKDFVITTISGEPKNLTFWAEHIRVEAGSQEPVYLYARLVNSHDNPKMGTPVQFQIAGGAGEIYPLNDVTDPLGMASAFYLPGPASTGTVVLEALVPGWPGLTRNLYLLIVDPQLTITLSPPNPSLFNPAQGETVGLPYEISKDASVSVEIYDRATNNLTAGLDGNSEIQGTHVRLWNGSGITGEGQYYYKVIGIDGNLNRTETDSRTLGESGYFSASTTLETITNVTTAERFAPPQDQLTIAYRVFTPNAATLVTLKVYNSRGELIRTILENESQAAGDQTALWDGLDDGGSLAAAGA
ncbi:MAG: Ig-like domain-containing protein, partial [Elusimicrobia bacterium]|nr:Ig-like domain-containing protein [Elusimicrobiota bacterium]